MRLLQTHVAIPSYIINILEKTKPNSISKQSVYKGVLQVFENTTPVLPSIQLEVASQVAPHRCYQATAREQMKVGRPTQRTACISETC